MGYKKIVQYGDTIELYEYEKELKRPDKGQSHLKFERLLNGQRNNDYPRPRNVIKDRKKLLRIQQKLAGTYRRSERSIKRSKRAFFRLVHHNNCLATTIHFVTITFAYDLTPKEAARHVSRFMARITKAQPHLSLSYISVPELTKKGRLHFHLLVYGLPPEAQKTERATRNFQRQFQRGYIDIVSARDASPKIAGYMAKYMAKAIGDNRYKTERGYTCSRNIKTPTSYGSNSFDEYMDMIIPEDIVEKNPPRIYDVPYLGACRFTKIKTQLCNQKSEVR